MKVLFIAREKTNGELSPIILAQGESLRKEGIDLNYFAITQNGLFGYIRSIFMLRRHLENQEYHLLHAHYGFTGIVALLARRREKLVVSFMGDDILGSNRSDGTVKLLSKIFGYTNVYLSRFFYDFSIVKSQEMLLRLKHTKSLVVPNGVDTKKFYPKEKVVCRESLNIDKTIKLVIFVSNPQRIEKNYILANEAVSLLSDLGVSLCVVYGVSPEKLNDYYNAADVLVLTSFHEGSPNVVKEAMSCGTPIVSTRVGDVEWLLNEISGCYISCSNPVELSSNIRKALEFSLHYGKTDARDKVFKLELDSPSIAKRIINIYQTL